MAAFGLNDDRRLNSPKRVKICEQLLDPGAYQYAKPGPKPNKVPFLSRARRKMDTLVATSWTDAIYNAALPHRIQNVTAFKSKKSRFPYEAFSEEDLKEMLCNCGFDLPCECRDVENEPLKQIICQGKVRRRIFKGRGPRIIVGDQQEVIHKKVVPEPPFYDAKVKEFTEFYKGCKWSKWTSKRTQEFKSEIRPGPADYTIERKPTEDEVCAERVRHHKRKTSRQLRFIEMVQQQNILEGRPGPASYTPKLLTDNNMQFLGPKAERFTVSKITKTPGPADYWLNRDFDLIEPPDEVCHFTLPRVAFGSTAERLVPRRDEGPSPASYNISNKMCNILHCPSAPFNCSAVRFKPEIVEERDDDTDTVCEEVPTKVCQKPTWQFMPRSNTTMHLDKRLSKASEQDAGNLSQNKREIRRPLHMQYIAPFYSSDGRFQPWHNWVAVYGQQNIPGPCYYDLEPPKCLPAVKRGPLYRAKRFETFKTFVTPAPNTYDVGGGIATILDTKNKRLAENIEKRDKFNYEPPFEPKFLCPEERQEFLIQKCIDLLEQSNFPACMRSTPAVTCKKTFKDKFKHIPVMKPLRSLS